MLGKCVGIKEKFKMTGFSWKLLIIRIFISHRNPTQQVLYISSVTREDEGMYQCFAFNDNDMAQAAAQLTVSGKDLSFQLSLHVCLSFSLLPGFM